MSRCGYQDAGCLERSQIKEARREHQALKAGGCPTLVPWTGCSGCPTLLAAVDVLRCALLIGFTGRGRRILPRAGCCSAPNPRWQLPGSHQLCDAAVQVLRGGGLQTARSTRPGRAVNRSKCCGSWPRSRRWKVLRSRSKASAGVCPAVSSWLVIDLWLSQGKSMRRGK